MVGGRISHSLIIHSSNLTRASSVSDLVLSIR